MKRALLVGNNVYDEFTDLSGCVNDVNNLTPLLARNEDNTLNFHVQARTSDTIDITRSQLRQDIELLLSKGPELALFYFAGHGFASINDVTLVTKDGSNYDKGIKLSELLGSVQNSPIPEIIIILDCCFSGGAGGSPQIGGAVSIIRQGVSILTACRDTEAAEEIVNGQGLFSYYLSAALDGGAADILGEVTLASLYAYLTESFGGWEQSPNFKCNLEKLSLLRKCAPDVPLTHLQRLPEFFSSPDFLFPLDPSYEPEVDPRDEQHEAIFAILQNFRAAKLLKPVGCQHMYHAAMASLTCQLTPLGKHYWHRANKGNI